MKLPLNWPKRPSRTPRCWHLKARPLCKRPADCRWAGAGGPQMLHVHTHAVHFGCQHSQTCDEQLCLLSWMLTFLSACIATLMMICQFRTMSWHEGSLPIIYPVTITLSAGLQDRRCTSHPAAPRAAAFRAFQEGSCHSDGSENFLGARVVRRPAVLVSDGHQRLLCRSAAAAEYACKGETRSRVCFALAICCCMEC